MTGRGGMLKHLRCRGWRRLVWAEVDGTLPAVRRGALLRHLQACAACAAVLDQARLLDGALADAAPLQPSADFDRKLFLRLAAGVARPGRAALRERGDGDPMTGVDWALLGGMIAFAVVAVAVALILVLPAPAGEAVAGGNLGVTRVLSIAAQAPAAAIDEISRGLLRHPLAAPILLAAGLLAITLGGVRVILTRSAS